MSGGFTPAPGTNYARGDEAIIARRLDRLARALNIQLTGLSGYRSPQHSVAVGGFRDDPHTRGAASDTPGIEHVPESTLNSFGLTRPFPGDKELNHIQLLPDTAPKAKRPDTANRPSRSVLGVIGTIAQAPLLPGEVAIDVLGGPSIGAEGELVDAAGNATSAVSGAAGNIVKGAVAGAVTLVQGYGVRLLEILAGAVGVFVSIMLLTKAAGAPIPTPTDAVKIAAAAA